MCEACRDREAPDTKEHSTRVNPAATHRPLPAIDIATPGFCFKEVVAARAVVLLNEKENLMQTIMMI